MGVLPPRDSKTQRPKRQMERWEREIDAGAPETGRDCGTAGQRVIWEMLTQRGRHRARERLRDQVVPQHPHPLPQTQQTRAAPSLLPGCARPRTMHPCPGSSRGSWRVGWALGGGAATRRLGCGLCPQTLPAPLASLPGLCLLPACMEHLLCVPEMPPCLSWHSLLSPVPSSALRLFFLCFWLPSLEEMVIY